MESEINSSSTTNILEPPRENKVRLILTWSLIIGSLITYVLFKEKMDLPGGKEILSFTKLFQILHFILFLSFDNDSILIFYGHTITYTKPLLEVLQGVLNYCGSLGERHNCNN